jgi:hypothetical protein
LFLRLGVGDAIWVNDDNRPFLLSLAREFENTELYELLLKTGGSARAVGRLSVAMSDPQFFELVHQSTIDLIAENFGCFGRFTLNQIPLPALAQILSSDHLRIPSEDWLYVFVGDKVSMDPQNFELFRFVLFEHLSAVAGAHFVDFARDYLGFFQHVPQLWDAIGERLALPVRPDTNNPHCPDRRHALPPAHPDDILFALKQRNGGKLEDGIVEITSKSNSGECGSDVKNLLDLENDLPFTSEDAPDQWTGWDFRDKRVALIGYEFDCPEPRLASLHIEGSVDGETWTTIDDGWFEQTDISADVRRGCYDWVTHSGKSLFLRLTQSDENSLGDHRLSLRSFRWLGTIEDAVESMASANFEFFLRW